MVNSPEEQAREQLRRQEVQILVTQLMKNEEATIKLLIDRLLETGATNFINRKVTFGPASRGLKACIGMAKPIGRWYGYRWLCNKTPRMITKWLFSKVAFNPPQPKPTPSSAPKTIPVQGNTVPENLPQVDYYQRQIRQLQAQVRVISGVAVFLGSTLGGVVLWQNSAVFFGTSDPQPPQIEAQKPWQP
jgi:hypothetical protein